MHNAQCMMHNWAAYLPGVIFDVCNVSCEKNICCDTF